MFIIPFQVCRVTLAADSKGQTLLCDFAVAAHGPLESFALTSVSLSDLPFLYDIIGGVV